MAFVVTSKRIPYSIQPENIIQIIIDNYNLSVSDLKYYEKRKLNEELKTYTLRIKFNSFYDDNINMNIFHNELMTNEWIKLNINNFVFKIKLRLMDYYYYYK